MMRWEDDWMVNDGEKSVWFARKRLPGEVDVLFELRKLQEFQVLICLHDLSLHLII